MRFLVAESEPGQARDRRRASVGRSSGETFRDLLLSLAPGAHVDRVMPVDGDGQALGVDVVRGYDAVFITGSPIHLYEDSAEARSVIRFMRGVFESGTPSFGSCAGLQVAAAAAGGVVRHMDGRREAGFARRITPTDRGRDHPLLAGRPPAWDAISVHTDEVEALPEGGTPLATNGVTAIQAAEIRVGSGVFWGVQYHPELSLEEAAAALRRQVPDIVESGLARNEAEVEIQAALVDALAREPDRADLRWRLGLDAEVADRRRRTVEIRNFVEHLVKPIMAERGR